MLLYLRFLFLGDLLISYIDGLHITIPPIQGVMVDKLDAHTSYILTVGCFAYLAWYAYKVTSVFKKQGISTQVDSEGGH